MQLIVGGRITKSYTPRWNGFESRAGYKYLRKRRARPLVLFLSFGRFFPHGFENVNGTCTLFERWRLTPSWRGLMDMSTHSTHDELNRSRPSVYRFMMQVTLVDYVSGRILHRIMHEVMYRATIKNCNMLHIKLACKCVWVTCISPLSQKSSDASRAALRRKRDLLCHLHFFI